MKVFISIVISLAIVVIMQSPANAKVISGKEIDGLAKLTNYTLPTKSYSINKKENKLLFEYKNDQYIYEMNFTPINKKGKSKHNRDSKEMCQVEQQKLVFYRTPNTYTAAFKEYFDTNGKLKNPSELVPRLITYVRGDNSVFAIDAFHNLLHFQFSGEPKNKKLALYATKYSYLNQGEDPNQVAYPVLQYIKIKAGDQKTNVLYLIWKDKVKKFENEKLLVVNGWTGVKQIERVKSGYSYGYEIHKKNGYSTEPQLFVAAGSDGLFVYNIDRGNQELKLLKQFQGADFGINTQDFYVSDIDHKNPEHEIFVLEKSSGVYRIFLSVAGQTVSSASLTDKNTFFLDVKNGFRMAHFTKHKEFQQLQQSFLILQKSGNYQYVSEFDYDKMRDLIWEAQRDRYIYHFTADDIIMAENYAILIGNHYSQVIRHSIYHKYTDTPYHTMSKKEQYEKELKDTFIIPGLLALEFYDEEFDDASEFLYGKHSYVLGITLHDVVLFQIKEFGPKVTCNLSKKSVDGGNYAFKLGHYENVCSIDPDNLEKKSYSDFDTCHYTRVININVEETVDDSMPWWGILLIVLTVLIFVGLGIFAGIKIYKARKLEQNNKQHLTSMENDVHRIEEQNKEAKYQVFKEDNEEDLHQQHQ